VDRGLDGGVGRLVEEGEAVVVFRRG